MRLKTRFKILSRRIALKNGVSVEALQIIPVPEIELEDDLN